MKIFGVNIKNGTESAGKVLTSDANGKATWQTPTGGGGGSFAGTFTPGPVNTPNTITHSLGTTDIDVTLRDLTTGDVFLADKIDAITTTQVNVTFKENPAGNVRVVVLASGGVGSGTSGFSGFSGTTGVSGFSGSGGGVTEKQTENASAVTTGNAQLSVTNIFSGINPQAGCIPKVSVDGIQIYVAKDDTQRTTSDGYFSSNSGATAVAFASLVGTEDFYWNGIVAGYDLDALDVIICDFTI
jgi:hypothetical protein